MKRWILPIFLIAAAYGLAHLYLQYSDNHITRFANGTEKRDVYGPPIVTFGAGYIDYVCLKASCPLKETRVVEGIYTQDGISGRSALVWGALVPFILLLSAAFFAGRNSVRRP